MCVSVRVRICVRACVYVCVRVRVPYSCAIKGLEHACQES